MFNNELVSVKVKRNISTIVALLMLTLSVSVQANLSQDQVNSLIKKIDAQTAFDSDFQATVFLQQKHREKGDRIFQAAVYRRDENNRFMMLFVKPKAEAGKGYLVIDRNLFLYSPNTGDWSRVSEDRIEGTDTNLQDFESWNLSERYNARYMKEDRLGKIPVYHIELTAKEGQQVDVAKMELWVEQSKNHVLKVQEFALSGKLLRTTYRTKWKPIEDTAGKTRYLPLETRVYDEVEKGNQTMMVVGGVDLSDLPENIFSKAWLESKSR